jgi:hypothetical protein
MGEARLRSLVVPATALVVGLSAAGTPLEAQSPGPSPRTTPSPIPARKNAPPS